MSGDPSARCADHSAPAIGVCERCGAFICEQCGFREREHLRCHRCGAPAPEKPPTLVSAALIIAALGLFCPPVSLVGIGLALAWRLGRGERSALGLQYARWTVAVGLMALAAGAAISVVIGRVISATGSMVDAIEARNPPPAAPSPGPVEGGEEP